jgi:hypothetical protein
MMLESMACGTLGIPVHADRHSGVMATDVPI